MDRLNIGIIGCGAVAQVQHLPILRDLPEKFTIGGISDLSPKLLDVLGDEYGVPPEYRYLNYHALLDSDIDAVIICPFGSHAPPAIAAAERGKHVFVEKPMCVTPDEARAMVDAAERAGVTLMVGYMKRYDPAYRYAQSCIREMSDIRFVQVNHLHPDNSLHLDGFKVHRFDDIPQHVLEQSFAEQHVLIGEALGISPDDDAPDWVYRAYTTVLGSMIHDIGNLHGTLGPPSRVVSTEIWADGRGISTTLEYAGDIRAVCTWVDLPELWEFKETLEFYGSRERVLASFPTGFSKGLPSNVTLHGMDHDRTPWRRELSWHANPFKLELEHFRDCVLTGRQPDTDGRQTIHDIELVRDIVLAHLHG